MTRNRFHLSVWTVSSLGLSAPGVWWVGVWLRGAREPAATGDRTGGRPARLPQWRPQGCGGGEEKLVTRWALQPAVRLLQEARVWPQQVCVRPGTARPRRGRDDGEAASPSPDTASAGAQRAGPEAARGGRPTSAAGPRGRGREPGSQAAGHRLASTGSIASTPSSWSLAAWKTTVTNYYHKRVTSWESGETGTRSCVAESLC